MSLNQLRESTCVILFVWVSGKELMGYVASVMFIIYMALRIYKAYLDIKDRKKGEKDDK